MCLPWLDLRFLLLGEEAAAPASLMASRSSSFLRLFTSFISFFLGVSYTEVPPFDFSRILKETTPKTPVLFMNGPNVNCLNELNTFKDIRTENAAINIEY